MKEKIKRDEEREVYFMEVAKLTSRLSTCRYTQVGAVAVRDKHIIATGYNGTISGMDHCTYNGPESRDEHLEYSNKYEIHAEMNVIMDALDRGQSLRDCVIYTTLAPCWNCLKHLKRARVKGIVYNELYWRVSEKELKEMVNFCYDNPEEPTYFKKLT